MRALPVPPAQVEPAVAVGVHRDRPAGVLPGVGQPEPAVGNVACDDLDALPVQLRGGRLRGLEHARLDETGDLGLRIAREDLAHESLSDEAGESRYEQHEAGSLRGRALSLDCEYLPQS